jgi:hypothetical protein
MNDALRLLNGDLTEEELTTLLERLKQDSALRDDVSTQQLIQDTISGTRALDNGYTVRILARLRQAQATKR